MQDQWFYNLWAAIGQEMSTLDSTSTKLQDLMQVRKHA